MPVTQYGIVYYDDDPHQRVFRTVHPINDDRELDDPPTDVVGVPMVYDGHTLHDWTTIGTDHSRPRKMVKLALDSAHGHKIGTPMTLASEPVVYWINAALILNGITEAQQAQLQAWLAANQQWSNNFIDLGSGDVATLSGQCLSPCWIVIVGGGTPAIGALQRSQTFRGQNIALWIG